MSYIEIIIVIIMALSLVLILIRCFGIREGKILKRYEIGKSMTIGNRQVQEDYYGICRTQHGLLAVLADGMGKNYGGKIAGQIAVETIKELFLEYNSFENPIYFFRKSFQAANREIVKELEDGKGSACVAAAVIVEQKLYYALVGNIKIAVYRKKSLIPLSAGHTIDVLAEERYSRGKLTRDDAIQLLESNRLYNYVGQDGFSDIEFFDTPVSLQSGDIIVIMSDGIFEGITWKELEECLGSGQRCQEKAYEIIEMINASSQKEKDNASIILIEQP